MKTQTDRKIADELQRTYDVQREAQIRRQALERETAAANMQAEVVRSEQMVRIYEQNAAAQLATARGESEARTIRATAQAEVIRTEAAAAADARRLQADADADAIRVLGEAEAGADKVRGMATAARHQAGVDALGGDSYTAVQLAQILGTAHMKLVPDVVLGDGKSGLADVLLARMATGNHKPAGGGNGVSTLDVVEIVDDGSGAAVTTRNGG
jgi:hypothetical protein